MSRKFSFTLVALLASLGGAAEASASDPPTPAPVETPAAPVETPAAASVETPAPAPIAETPTPAAAPAPVVAATAPPVEHEEHPAVRRDGEQGMRDGTFLPETLSARIGDQRAMGLAYGGYDTTSGQGAVMNTVVEGALFRRVALRAGVEYMPGVAKWSPSIGVRVGILRQERFGFDLGAAALYKNTGFTEAKGEFELVVSAGRRWDKLALFGNLVYGQGLDPGERDGEVRVALTYQLHRRVHLGADARGRFDLGEETAARMQQQLESNFDLIAGPLVAATVHHFVFFAQPAARMVVMNERAHGGFAALAGVGAIF